MIELLIWKIGPNLPHSSCIITVTTITDFRLAEWIPSFARVFSAS